MRAIRRILVAIKNPADPTPASVAKAVQLAKALKARVELFHSLSAPLMLDSYTALDGALVEIEAKAAEQARERLERMAVPFRRSRVSITTAVEWDYPVHEAILRRARQIGAGLIVAERHVGHHNFPGVLKITDWELLRLSPVPVLLVKTGGTYAKPALLAAVDPSHSYSKPTGLDRQILQVGALFSRALRGPLHAVHAYVPFSEPLMETGVIDPGVIQDIADDAAEKAGKQMAKALRKSGIPATRQHLVGRHPTEAIDEIALQTHSAMVIMGAISRSGLKRFVIGNTAETLLDRLECDLLIVKPPGFPERVPHAGRGVRLVSFAQVPGL